MTRNNSLPAEGCLDYAGRDRFGQEVIDGAVGSGSGERIDPFALDPYLRRSEMNQVGAADQIGRIARLQQSDFQPVMANGFNVAAAGTSNRSYPSATARLTSRLICPRLSPEAFRSSVHSITRSGR